MHDSKRYYAHQTLQKINETLETQQESSFRSHLGASILGQDCVRKIWYVFHWARDVKHSGRLLRLFSRGHEEEVRVVRWLRMAGIEVWETTPEGKQFRVSGYKGHVGGSIDGVVRGVPEMPEEPMLAEFKTFNDKTFGNLQSHGVRDAKMEHYVQMQYYMGQMNLRIALYIPVCKNDDEMQPELVAFNPEAFSSFSARAAHIVDSPLPPPKISKDPSWYKCKMCDFHKICHGPEVAAVNCRTCYHSSPVDNGEWVCNRHKTTLDDKAQRAGCSDHFYIDELQGLSR